jgi:hypothetical protein
VTVLPESLSSDSESSSSSSSSLGEFFALGGAEFPAKENFFCELESSAPVYQLDWPFLVEALEAFAACQTAGADGSA